MTRKTGRLRRADRRLRRQRAVHHSWRQPRYLAIGLTALLVVAGVGVILLGSGRVGGSDRIPEVSQDKSMGAPDARVTVVEYGDFQ